MALTEIQCQSAADRATHHHSIALRGVQQLVERRDSSAKDVVTAKDKAKRLQKQAIKEAPQDVWFEKFKHAADPVPDDLHELDTMIADVFTRFRFP
jgi:hypothetical protein